MRRTRLERKTPLRRTPLQASKEAVEFGTGPYQPTLKRTRLKALSEKGRRQRDADAAQVRDEGTAFHDAIRGLRCVVCGRTASEARLAGTWHQSHHVVRQEVMRRLGLREQLWCPDAAVCCCEQPCHAEHTSRKRRIPYSALPARAVAFAKRHGLLNELEREYPTC